MRRPNQSQPPPHTQPNPESDITMTVQLIIMGTRRPDSDDDYAAYGSVAVPIMVAAGGTFTGQYGRIDDLVGDDGPQVVGIMEFATKRPSAPRSKAPSTKPSSPTATRPSSVSTSSSPPPHPQPDDHINRPSNRGPSFSGRRWGAPELDAPVQTGAGRFSYVVELKQPGVDYLSVVGRVGLATLIPPVRVMSGAASLMRKLRRCHSSPSTRRTRHPARYRSSGSPRTERPDTSVSEHGGQALTAIPMGRLPIGLAPHSGTTRKMQGQIRVLRRSRAGRGIGRGSGHRRIPP
jgi:hypothetical protein